MQIRRFSEEFGINQKQIWSKLVDWFLQQEQSAQFAILGLLPHDAKEVMADVFRRMADDLSRSSRQKPGSQAPLPPLKQLGGRTPPVRQ